MVSAAAALIVLIACGQKEETAAPPAEPAPAPAPSAPTEPSAAREPSAAPTPSPTPSMTLPAIPEGAKVFFVEPTEGAKIQGPLVDGKVSVPVKMGAEKIEVKPAGQIEAGSGHHHIIIDTASDAEGTVVAKDEQHQHYGQGQTEAQPHAGSAYDTLTVRGRYPPFIRPQAGEHDQFDRSRGHEH